MFLSIVLISVEVCYMLNIAVLTPLCFWLWYFTFFQLPIYSFASMSLTEWTAKSWALGCFGRGACSRIYMQEAGSSCSVSAALLLFSNYFLRNGLSFLLLSSWSNVYKKISLLEGLLQISSILELCIMPLYVQSLLQLRPLSKWGYIKKWQHHQY